MFARGLNPEKNVCTIIFEKKNKGQIKSSTGLVAASWQGYESTGVLIRARSPEKKNSTHRVLLSTVIVPGIQILKDTKM